MVNDLFICVSTEEALNQREKKSLTLEHEK